MKKFLSLVLVFVCVVCVAGCSKADFTCTGKLEGQEATVTGTTKGDTVTNLKIESVADAKSEKEAEQGAALINGFGSLAKDQGITMSAKVSGKTVTTTMEIDVVKASKSSSSSSSAGFDLSDSSKDKIIKALEDEGLTCK